VKFFALFIYRPVGKILLLLGIMTPAMRPSERSSGVATDEAMVSGEAPGSEALIMIISIAILTAPPAMCRRRLMPRKVCCRAGCPAAPRIAKLTRPMRPVK
jgi:hypothetical protein